MKTKRQYKWPKSAPFLTAIDIFKGSYDGPNETHCLRGWSISVGSGGKISNAMEKIVPRGALIAFNDDRKNSKSKIAAVWNKAVRSLGYVKRGKIFVKKGK